MGISSSHKGVLPQEDDPFEKRYILVYSLGDEMYKWASPTSLYDSFEDHKDKKYSYPPGGPFLQSTVRFLQRTAVGSRDVFQNPKTCSGQAAPNSGDARRAHGKI